MTLSSSGFLHAVLGPTNTGKTHYALSRMIGHESGIIGFPLRLLARENYERLVRLKGEESVGLITGEEKIIPAKAKWFSCTVESMPLERRVNFIAIDEIQLAGDPDRGHIFTNRLLYARGKEETLFLGAEIIRPLLKKLLPNIVIETRPRLSKLIYTGPTPLTRLPPRTALVAFSASEVYSLAETIRQKKGGCALIMGRLSPRTRNAQIELYQKGEVDYLVATDAIGMGLNMDVDHVALSSLRKFDGRVHRSLTLQEIAQIAGRAGRGMKDGTFGTISHSDALPTETITAIETHNFSSLKQIYWRQNHLDFTNPHTLLKSLQTPSLQTELIKGREASDLAVLEYLTISDLLKNSVFTPKTTRILWEVCQIPDFKKLGDDSHAQLCGKLFLHLLKEGKIPTDWIEGQLRFLNQSDADIDTLMQRLQTVRICSYIAAHPNWLPRNNYWQKRSHEVENNLSDALHERLMARFVNKRAVSLFKNFSEQKGELFYKITKDKHILVEGHDIGLIKGFTIELDQSSNQAEKAILLKTARRALQFEMPSLIRHFLTEKPSALSFQAQGLIIWDNIPIGQIKRGKSYFVPEISLFPGDFQDMAQRHTILKHLHFMISSLIDELLLPLEKARECTHNDPQLRGIIHRLYDDGGMTLKQKSDNTLSQLQRRILRQDNIVVGKRYIYCAPLFKAPLQQIFLHLHAAWHKGHSENLQLLAPGIIKLGTATLSVVKLEKILKLLPDSDKNARNLPAPYNLASLLGVKQKAVLDILKIINIAYQTPQTLPKNIYGPPAPLMLKAALSPKKGKKKQLRTRIHCKKQKETPFNILKNLRFRK